VETHHRVTAAVMKVEKSGDAGVLLVEEWSKSIPVNKVHDKVRGGDGAVVEFPMKVVANYDSTTAMEEHDAQVGWVAWWGHEAWLMSRHG
jgi:hypothetical protein